MSATLKLKTNNGERRVPTDWSAVTTDKYQQWAKLNTTDIITVMSTMYDLTEAYIMSLDERSEIAVTLFAGIDFTRFDPHLGDLRMPESVEVAGKTVKLQPQLTSLTVGQAIQLRRKLEPLHQTGGTWDEIISFCCAVYLQPLLDNDVFDLTRALQYEADIKQLPIMQTYPIGFFYLPSIRTNGGIIPSYLHRMKTLLVRSTSSLPKWHKLTGSRTTRTLTT